MSTDSKRETEKLVREKNQTKSMWEVLQVTEGIKYFFNGVNRRDKTSGGLGDKRE